MYRIDFYFCGGVGLTEAKTYRLFFPACFFLFNSRSWTYFYVSIFLDLRYYLQLLSIPQYAGLIIYLTIIPVLDIQVDFFLSILWLLLQVMRRIFTITNDAIMSILIHIFFHIYAFMLGRVLEVGHILLALKIGMIKCPSKSFTNLHSTEQGS